MPGRQRDWYALLAAAHQARTGVGESVLQQATAGQHTPYRWLARAVSTQATQVLDIACGSGAMSRQLARPGRTVIGVDARPAELAAAAERSSGPWICADARQLPFPDDSFDAVTSALGLAVIHPTDRLIGEIARLLKPGGVLALMAPALWPQSASDLATITRLGARLGSRPRLPGVAHRAEIDAALAAHRLRRMEVRRERYRFRVASAEDAELIVHGLYLPPRGQARRDAAVRQLVHRIEHDGPVDIAIPLRRIVALK